MPTSPRDLAGGTGRYQPTALFSNPRADEGHRPLRERETFAFHRGPFLTFRGPLHTRPCGATLSKQERAGDSADEGRYQVRHPTAPHPSRALPGPPSPRRGSGPTPVRASPCHPLPGEGFSPHPARAAPGPPSPEGKATSGGGMIPATSSGGGMIPAPYYWRGLTIPALSGLFPGFPRLRRNN